MARRDASTPNPFQDNYYMQRLTQTQSQTTPYVEPRGLVDVDSIAEAEMLAEIPALLKRIIDSSPFAKDTVSLSLRAQMMMEELRQTSPLNPFVFLHNNIRKFIKIRNGIILKLLPFKGYRLIFANGDRRFK